MDKNYQNVLALLPYGINIFILGRSKILRILIFTIIAGIQILIFLAIKPPSCHDIECPKIEKNYERILFYEKYNIQDDDLNLLRSEHFQQSYIINAFNFQLGVFLIFFPLYYQGKYEKMINPILYVILAVFSSEASLLLTTEIIKIPYFNFTYFELFSFIRIQEISLILIVREICSFFHKTNVEILRSSFNKFSRIGTGLKQGDHHRLIEQQDILETKPEVSLFSTEFTRFFIAIFGIYQMFL